MTDPEDKDRDLREINNEIAQAMQHWKMTAAQKDNEKLQLMRENNDLRHQLSALRNAQLSWTRKLSAELQTASEELLTHLVKASGVVTNMLELTKSTMQDHMEPKLPRWSTIGSTPTADKVNRVPPTIVGGRHIQPVVSLSRTLQPNNSGSINSSSPNQNNGREPPRAVPMLLLHRLPIIPLTRIEHERNWEANVEQDMDEDSTEDLPSETSERMDESSSAREDFEEPDRHLEPVPEEEELETGHEDSSRAVENPLEGPSWLLDSSSLNTMRRYQNPRRSQPNSSLESDVNEPSPGPSRLELQMEPVSVTVECEFTPTVRRRRRVAPHDLDTPSPLRSPHRSPRRSPPPTRRVSNSSRVLKVMVTKMRLSDDEDDSDDDMPPKKSKNIAIRQPAKRPASDETGQTEILPKRPNLDETPPKPQKISQRRFPDTPKRGESSPTKRHSTDGSPIIHLNPSQRFMLYDTPSPKGSTDARVIVLESRNDEPEPCCSGVARSRRLNRGSSCEIRNNHNRSDHGNHNRLNHSNEDNRRRKNSHDTPTSQPIDNSNSNSNDGNHNNSNRGVNLVNRHNNSNEDNRRRNNSRDTSTSQLNDDSNSNHDNHNNNNHDTNLANRHNNNKKDNRRRNNSRDTSTSQLNDDSNSNHDNHNNNNHDTNLANRHNNNKKDNRRRKKGRDTPTSQLSDDSSSNHSNNSSRNDTTNTTASNHVNINSNSLPLDRSDGRNNNGIDSDSSGNSDLISEARTRRPRKAVIYKEKPLNRKLRR